MSENGFGSNGSAPTPEQFRRRRIVAGAIAALVLLLLIWGMVSLVGAIRGSGNDASAVSSETATSAPFSDFSERPSSSASESASDDATEPASAEATDSASAESTDSASADASESASAEATKSAEATAEPTESATAEATETAAATESAVAEASATPSATETTEAAVVACSANDLKVAITADQQSYAAGANPALAITYTNTSGTPCTVGGDVKSIDINITSGAAQVYNSSQCQQGAQEQSELAGGSTGTVVMTWDRKLNSLGCANPVAIKPGYYWATATVNGVASTPARIIITG